MSEDTWHHKVISDLDLSGDFSVHVFGECIVKDYADHVRINKRDWNKFKQRLIPVLKEETYASGNTEAGKVGIDQSSPTSGKADDIGGSHW